MGTYGIDRSGGAGGSGATQNYTPVTDVFDGDGSTVAFTLTVAPGSASALVARVSGVVQTPGVDFTVSSNVITFTTAPASGTDNIVVQNFGVAWSVATVAGSAITGLTADLVEFVPSGSGTIAGTVDSKLQEIASLFDFMTAAQKADVRAATALVDVSPALDLAVTWVKEKLGRRLYVPAGRYLCESTITLDKIPFLTFHGEGGRIAEYGGTGSQLKGSVFVNSVGGVLFDIVDTAGVGEYRTRGFTFDGIGVDQLDDTNDIAFRMANGYDKTRFRNGAIRGGKYGCSFAGSSSPFNIKWEDFDFYDMQSGCFLPNRTDMSGGDFLNMQWEDCTFRYCTRYGVEALQGNSTYFKNCVVEACELGGLYLKGVFFIELTGNHFEQNSATGAEYDVYVLPDGANSTKVLRCSGNTYTADTSPTQAVQFQVDDALSMVFDGESFGGTASTASLNITTPGGRGVVILGGAYVTAPVVTGATVHYFPRTGHVLFGTVTDNTSGDKNAQVQLIESSSSGAYLGNTNNTGKKVLDWYEEGTWTPALNFGGAATGMTYGAQSGGYTRIGNTLIAWCRILLSAKGSATGAPTITGMPFATANAADQNATGGGVMAFWGGFAAGITESPHIFTTQNSATLTLRKNAAAGLTAMSEADFTDTTNINFTIVTRVA